MTARSRTHLEALRHAHLGWYVGDGAGARARLAAVRPHLVGTRVTVLTTGPAVGLSQHDVEILELPWSIDGPRPGASGGPDAETTARLARWLAADRPDLLVVDGEQDLGRSARRAGVATVTLRRPGVARGSGGGDLSSSAGQLAAYPPVLEPDATPRWVRERTVHTGLLSRYAGRQPHRRAGRRALGIDAEARVVTVICGRDGLRGAGDLAAAAAATPAWTWVTVGRCGTPLEGIPDNLRRLGWTDDPWSALEAADVVVASGALSVVAEVASARRPLLLLPRDDRPEDAVAAAQLAALGAVRPLGGWPGTAAWPTVLAEALAFDPAPLARLEDARGPARAADWLTAWARGAAPADPAVDVLAPRVGRQRARVGTHRVVDLTRPAARTPSVEV